MIIQLFSAERRSHTLALVACLGILAIGVALRSPQPGSEVLLLAGFRLPQLCSFKRTTGLDCPGCGLTRSVTASLHGQLTRAFGWNPVGPLVAVYVFLQALRHALWFACAGWRTQYEERWGGVLDRAILVIVGLLLVQWLWRIGPSLKALVAQLGA